MTGVNIKVGSDIFGGSSKSWIATRMGLQDMRSITLDVSAFSQNNVINGRIPSGTALGKITATGKYGPYGNKLNEVQTITIDATGGTFTITPPGQGTATAAIAYNATAAAVQAALELLPGINVGDIVVTGGPGATAAYTLTYGGQFTGTNVAAATTGAGSLTGGAGTATVATTVAGGGGTSDGTEVLAGHLFEDFTVDTGIVGTGTDGGAALYWTGVVKEANLPVFTGTVGEVDAVGKQAVAAWIRYE